MNRCCKGIPCINVFELLPSSSSMTHMKMKMKMKMMICSSKEEKERSAFNYHLIGIGFHGTQNQRRFILHSEKSVEICQRSYPSTSSGGKWVQIISSLKKDHTVQTQLPCMHLLGQPHHPLQSMDSLPVERFKTQKCHFLLSSWWMTI